MIFPGELLRLVDYTAIPEFIDARSHAHSSRPEVQILHIGTDLRYLPQLLILQPVAQKTSMKKPRQGLR
jgi:hypothetical protein